MIKKRLLILITGIILVASFSQAIDITSMQTNGIKWLVEQQRDNGSLSNENYPAMTALGLWALVTSSPDYKKEKQMAADFVASFAQADGGIYKTLGEERGSGGLSTYNTAICMTALYKYNKLKYRDIILEARRFVASSQLLGDSPGSGGFGYNLPNNTSRDRADLSNTAWALQAMRTTQDLEEFRQGEKVDINWNQVQSYVQKLQIQDGKDKGAFEYTKTGERTQKAGSKEPLRTFGSMTYAGLESLIFADVKKTDPMIISTIEWVGKNWTVEENPGMGIKGLFYYFNILGKSLDLFGGTIKMSDGTTLNWRKDLQEKLMAEQKPNGSWVNTDGQFWETDPILVTSYSLITLSYTKE